MKIVAVEVYQKTYRLQGGPFVMSGGRVVSEQDSTVVRVEADSGEYGWGEQCSFSPAYIAGHARATVAALPILAAAVMGSDPREVEVVHDRMDEALVGHAYAKSALDIACWDLFGRAVGLRVAELLGGVRQEEVPLYKAVSLGEPSAMAKRASEIQAEGYRTMQVKVGDYWRDDVERVTRCANAAPDIERVVVDANGHWPQHDAIRAVGRLGDLDLYIEQPCQEATQCLAVRRASRKPVVLDESLTCVEDIRRAAGAGALDVARLKLSRLGGITPLRKARDFCLATGVAVSIEDSAGGDIVSAAAVQVAASVAPHGLFDVFVPSGEVSEHITVEPVVPQRGQALVPKGSGLGIEVDTSALGQPVARFP
jgi:L-alanine-DL-glutamate epimerase-like enolase superfamily enzyme